MTTYIAGPTAPRAANKLFIDGHWVTPSSALKIDVVDPSTEEIVLTVAAAQEADIADAVGAARKAFDHGPWPKMTPGERGEYLRRIADALESRADDVCLAQAMEMGIVHSVASRMVPRQINYFRQYADLAASWPFVERHQPDGDNVAFVVKEPVGVVGAIIPWNGPLMMMAHKVGPALIAGCTVILKAAPQAPYEALLLAEIAEDIGLPPGVLNVVTAENGPSEALVRDPRVDKITFTGSTAAGRRIAALCGERLARLTLELGGKSAAVVLDDYDIGTAAAAVASHATFNTGQACAALTRIVVTRARHDDMVDALSEVFGKVRVGNALDPVTDMGPLAMRRQRDRVETYIAKGVAEGARLAHGGTRPADLDRGWFIQPTVFAEVDNSSTISREEIFGPVLCVIPADDEQQAIDIANDTDYGLDNSVFTHDVDRAYQIARQLRSGTVGHNQFRADLGLTFGGFKQSGIGREGVLEGLSAYQESKTIIMDAEPRDL